MIVGGSEFEHYDSLAEMASAADLVVQASFVDFRRGRTFYGDAEEDVVHFAIVDLDISDVLRGGLVAERVTIEFLVTAHPDRIDEFFEAQESGLPPGELVLFLRDIAATEGHFYPDEGRPHRLVNSAGLWAEINGASHRFPSRLRAQAPSTALRSLASRRSRSLRRW